MLCDQRFTVPFLAPLRLRDLAYFIPVTVSDLFLGTRGRADGLTLMIRPLRGSAPPPDVGPLAVMEMRVPSGTNVNVPLDVVAKTARQSPAAMRMVSSILD